MQLKQDKVRSKATFTREINLLGLLNEEIEECFNTVEECFEKHFQN